MSAACCGIIILGNAGVGKSFLANILLDEDRFIHKFSPESVTAETEQADTKFDGQAFTIFNIPGLIEAEQDKIDRNKREIDKAFAQQPNSLILFVFGEQGGRIRDEDIVAFQAINKAYEFKIDSLILIINNLPADRDPDYEGETITFLKEHIHLSFDHICFLNEINLDDLEERQALREKILTMILRLQPHIHMKTQDIEMETGTIQELHDCFKEQRDQFKHMRAQHQEEIRRQQALYEEQIRAQSLLIHTLQTQTVSFGGDNSSVGSYLFSFINAF